MQNVCQLLKRRITSGLRGFRNWLRDPAQIYCAETGSERITIRVKQWLPGLVWILLFAWYIASPEDIVIMTLVALGGAVLVDFFWARVLALKVKGQRRLRYTAMQVGDELEEEIRLHDPHPFIPVLWAEFFDHSNIPGYTVSSVRGTDAGSEVHWRAHTICTRRGVYNLGPWEMRMGPPLGIFAVSQQYIQRQEILVYPQMAALPESLLPHRGALGDQRPHNQPLLAETIASNTVRAYAPGDPLRHIHWRTTARKEDTFVKVFSPEASSSIWLIPDFDLQSHVEEGENSSEETMVTVTASLAAALLQQRLSVGLFAAGVEDRIVLPRLGQNHLWILLQALAPLHAVPGRVLESELARARSLFTGNDLMIVITPSLRPEWSGILHSLAKNRSGGSRVEVILLDPASFVSETSMQGRAKQLAAFLLGQGIPTSLLRREEVNLISGYYGEISRWEFKIGGSGRAVAYKKPRAAEVMAAPLENMQSLTKTLRSSNRAGD